MGRPEPILVIVDAGLTGWRRVRVIGALGGATFGLLVVLLSFLPGAPLLPNGVQFIPFVMVFPIFGWAVIERAQQQARSRASLPGQKWYERGMTTNTEANRGWTQMLVKFHKYRAFLVIGVSVVILMWIVMMISIVTLPGQPERAGNRYYLDDHGSHVPVTKAGYESAVAKGERMFAAGATAFLVIAAGMTLTYDPKKGINGETAGLRPLL
jgi:hypothetical protein